MEAGRFLARRASFGMVWIDERLMVIARYGPLVDFVTVGEPLSASVIALNGLEDAIAALREHDGGPLTIPNVIMNVAGDPLPRISLDIHWMDAPRCYLMHVRNASDHSALEAELSTAIRQRAIAEAEILEKTAEIQRTNLELALANRDLEEFAHVVSHDLKAPLRALRYDRGDAERELAAGRPEQVQAKLTAIGGHEIRLRAMLDGLLAYARIGRKADAIEAIDTRTLIDAIVAGIARPVGIAIEVSGEWPVLPTLAAPLDLVLRNLVDNAIKHHDRSEGQITIAAREGRDTFTIFVADDGPGITREWQAAVFVPFGKAGDDTGRREGSGMGLALVRRTLDRIGGSISLTSDAPHQRGTTFLVRWPKTIAV